MNSKKSDLLFGTLLGVALALIQVLIGGTRLLFSLPAYGIVAIAAIATLFFWRKNRARPDQLCLIGAVVFFGYILARASFSPVAYLARIDIWSVVGGLLVYFLVACSFTETKARIWLLIFLLCLSLVNVGIGAIQFRDGNNYMLISWLQRFDYGRRASGFYGCPDHLAGWLEVVGVFGLSFVCWSRWPIWGKLLIAYATAVCYVGLALTGSRGGYLSVVASVGAFAFLSLFVLRKSSPRFFWKISAAALISIIALSAATTLLVQKSDYLARRVQSIYDKRNIRLLLWAAAIDQWKLQPITGTGSETYRFYGRQFRNPQVQHDPIEVHNDYLHLLAEYGIIGGAGFLFFLAAHLRRGLKDFQRLGPKRIEISPRVLSNALALNLGAVCAVITYIVHSAFDFNLHIPANVLLLAFVFGLLANCGAPGSAEAASSRPFLFWKLFLPALGLFTLAACWRFLPGEYFAERARTALRDHQLASAILFAQRGLKVERENPNLYFYLGRARMEQGGWMRDRRASDSFYRDALPAFAAAQSLAARDETYVLEIAFAYDALGRFAEAQPYYDAAIRLDPNSTSVQKYAEGHMELWQKIDPKARPN